MNLLLVVALISAGLSLGLRATALLLDPAVHPLDRLMLSIFAGALMVAVTLQVALSYRVFELGLGVLVSLAPVGPFDATKWWYRSTGRRAHWLSRAHASAVRLALRVAALIALAFLLIAPIVSRSL